ECPVARFCLARERGEVARFPELAAREKPRSRRDLSLAFLHEGAVLVGRRRADAVWGGLWELPRVTLLEGEPDEDAARRLGREVLGCAASLVRGSAPLATRRHTVMRERIERRVFRGELRGEPRSRAHAELRWVSPEEMTSLALPSPQRMVAASVREWAVHGNGGNAGGEAPRKR
ncbi:NUDIX domain-containing protein, partial [bacterium]|nr:NUDIX domain-containing protein [bacterium]